LVKDDDDEGDFDDDDEDVDFDAAVVTALLRVMVLRGGPPDDLSRHLSREHARVVEEGARLRAGLPAYLARRQAILVEHCPLIAPLLALVHGYETPTTTAELWATGLGAERQPQADGEARQRAARSRADDDDDTALLRRSLRLRQKRE
jgi:hypothetical protein